MMIAIKERKRRTGGTKADWKKELFPTTSYGSYKTEGVCSEVMIRSSGLLVLLLWLDIYIYIYGIYIFCYDPNDPNYRVKEIKQLKLKIKNEKTENNQNLVTCDLSIDWEWLRKKNSALRTAEPRFIYWFSLSDW